MLKDTKTASDYSIYVTNVPMTGVSKKDIVEHFSQYGNIQEVTFSRKFGNMMGEYKKQDALNKKIYKQEILAEIQAEDEEIPDKNVQKSKELLIKLKREDNEMEKAIRDKYPDIKSYDDLPVVGCFIIFDDVESCHN